MKELSNPWESNTHTHTHTQYNLKKNIKKIENIYLGHNNKNYAYNGCFFVDKSVVKEIK